MDNTTLLDKYIDIRNKVKNNKSVSQNELIIKDLLETLFDIIEYKTSLDKSHISEDVFIDKLDKALNVIDKKY
jgi:hypothetical protein